MSMYRAQNHRKRWQRRWPWKFFFPPRINERFCPECGLPFHEGPVPKEHKHLFVNNIVGHIFPAGGYRANEYVVRFGRWKAGGRQFYASEFIPLSDLKDLLTLIEQIQGQMEPKTTREGKPPLRVQHGSRRS